MKKVFLSITGLVVFLVAISIIYFTHWSVGTRTENREILLNCNTYSINQLHNAVLPLVKEWRSNGYLINFRSVFIGKDEIKNFKGITYLEYYSANDKKFGNEGKIMKIFINHETFSIYKIEYSPIIEHNREFNKMRVDNWGLTLDEVIKVILENKGNTVDELDDPYISISMGLSDWNVKLFSSFEKMQNRNDLGLLYDDLLIYELEINPIVHSMSR